MTLTLRMLCPVPGREHGRGVRRGVHAGRGRGAALQQAGQEWREESTQNINIPMQGEIDSMNVSVAAGILIFEAKRQRNFI